MNTPNTSCCEYIFEDGYKATHHTYDYQTGKCTKCEKELGHQSSHSKGKSWEETLHVRLRKAFQKVRERPIQASDYAAIKELVSKLLSDREKTLNEVLVKMSREYQEAGFAAGAKAERERILEQLPILIEPMDNDLKKGAGYLAAELRSLLTPTPPTE